jgi:hypothetical protein
VLSSLDESKDSATTKSENPATNSQMSQFPRSLTKFLIRITIFLQLKVQFSILGFKDEVLIYIARNRLFSFIKTIIAISYWKHFF